MSDIPVLFITFARPNYAEKTFEGIRSAKPRKLYFYSNKARDDFPDEQERNEQVRRLLEKVDWNCDLKVFLRDQHVNIYDSLWGAIDWIFDNEDHAIILEEDCVPSLAFFDFCSQLLPMYEKDNRVWLISGNNFIEGYNPHDYDYFFSPFAYQYGWASWKDRWQRLNRSGFDVNKIIEYDLYRQIYGSRKGANHAYKWLKKQCDEKGHFKTQAWDYTFQMTMRCNGGFGIVPSINLVSNIGEMGVHNKGSKNRIHNRRLPLSTSYKIQNHPPFVVSDFHFTNKFFDTITNRKTSFSKRLVSYLKRRNLN